MFNKYLRQAVSTGTTRTWERIVLDPPDYQTPPSWYIQLKLKQSSLRPPRGWVRTYMRDAHDVRAEGLTRDLAARDLGGEVVDDAQAQMHQYERDIIANADLSNVSGMTPIERAINYVATLESQERDGHPKIGGGEDVADALNQMWEKYQGMSAEEREELQALASGLEPGDGSEIPHAKVVSLIARGHIVDVMDTVARLLDYETHTQITHDVKFIADPEYTHLESRAIEGVHELQYLSPSEIALIPHFPDLALWRIANHEAQVTLRGRRFSRKQLVLMVIDVSGSMTEEITRGAPTPAQIATGMMLNRLRYQKQGKAEVWISFFGKATTKPVNFTNIKGAMAQMAHYSSRYGGGTDIPGALDKAKHFIDEDWQREREDYTEIPEVMLVTDGFSPYSDEQRDPRFWTVGGRLIRFNAFQIIDKHSFEHEKTTIAIARHNFTTICETTGGKYAIIDTEGNVLNEML